MTPAGTAGRLAFLLDKPRHMQLTPLPQLQKEPPYLNRP
jgi:hypothetical protein